MPEFVPDFWSVHSLNRRDQIQQQIYDDRRWTWKSTQSWDNGDRQFAETGNLLYSSRISAIISHACMWYLFKSFDNLLIATRTASWNGWESDRRFWSHRKITIERKRIVIRENTSRHWKKGMRVRTCGKYRPILQTLRLSSVEIESDSAHVQVHRADCQA